MPCQLKIEGGEIGDDDDDDHDNLVMDAACDLIGTCAKHCGAQIDQYFASFFPALLKFTKSSRSYTDRAMAIGCIGEVQYRTEQYNAVQYSTVQYSTEQYSTVQFSLI